MAARNQQMRTAGAGAAAVEHDEDEQQASQAGGLPTFTCTKCRQKFETGDWNCKDGKLHVVAEKTYYSPVGSWRVYVEEEELLRLPSGQTKLKPARLVQFMRGMFTTSNPIDQYALDNMEGLINAEQWREIYISEKERNDMKARELELKEKRLTERENALLAKEKQRVEAAGGAAV